MNLEWHIETRKLKDLKANKNNPRRLSKEAFKKLVKSIKEDGYHGRIMIDADDTIIGGHQRKQALLEAGFHKISEIEVLVPNRKLTQEEYNRINLRDNLPFGDFDFDTLSGIFMAEELIELGMPANWLPELEEEEDDEEELELKPKRKPKQCPECGADV